MAEIVVRLTVHQAVIAYTNLDHIDASDWGITRAAQTGAERILKALLKAGYDSQGRRWE